MYRVPVPMSSDIAGQGCTGCATSLLNSAFYADIGTLALDTLDINFLTLFRRLPGAYLEWIVAANQ